MNKLQLRKVYQIIAVVGVILLLLLGFLWFYNRTSIAVITDSSSLKLELNDIDRTITKKSARIVTSAGTYTYRATASVDGKEYSIQDTIDIEEGRNNSLTLNFNLFSKSAISKALCSNEGSKCLVKPNNITVNYYEANTWAVVFVNIPNLEQARAVLELNNGNWIVHDGPGTDIETDGLYPEKVERALNDAAR